MEMDIDCQEEHVDHGCDTGVYKLWLAVTFDAVREYTGSRGKNQLAKSYLFEKDNPFVEAVCDYLYISPEAMRERVNEKITTWR